MLSPMLGAGVALELLFHEYVSHIHINDINRPYIPSGRVY